MPELPNIPAPSPMPSPPIDPHSLSERINISTRPLHTQLNRLILTRLPLALPPYTTNPSVYISGLLHIVPIYSTFEGLWANILTYPLLPTTIQDACDPEQPLFDSNLTPLVFPRTEQPPQLHAPKICTRTHSLLTHLHLPGLLRTGRLRADIHVLTSTPDHKFDDQLASVITSGPLSDFLAHIKSSVEANPHVLLAYAWVLYMALFSGGRYLRAALKEAGGQGHTFWERDSSPVRPYSIDDSALPPRFTSRNSTHSQSEINTAPTHPFPPHTDAKPVPGLQFFDFIGSQDGEDLKLEFKKRITEAEILLTAREKEDIVVEAQHIFTYMLQLVNQLDSVVGTSDKDLETSANASTARGRPLNASRDSVSVAKERIRRNTIERQREQERAEEKDDGDMTQEQARKDGFLDVVVGPVAKGVEFKRRILSFDHVVRRFSRAQTREVSFADDKDADAKATGDEQVTVRETGLWSTMIYTLALLLLLVSLFFYTY